MRCYELTDKGRDLERAIDEVERWAHDWVAPAEHVEDGLAPASRAEGA